MDLLKSLGDGGGLGSAHPGNRIATSVEALQDQLHQLYTSKSSPTRAEHVSAIFELRHNTTFYLPPSNAGEAAIVAQPPPSPTSRTVTASEAVVNQSPDDPVLQKELADHIVGCLSAIDESSWLVREVSRGAQGWTFSYICERSLQAWQRQNGKNPKRPPIASFSGNGGLDPINAGRPAFDCRGGLTVAFSKPSRAVVVKYDHTPLHKTVQELIDLLPEPIIPEPVAGHQRSGGKRLTAVMDSNATPRKARQRKSAAAETLSEPSDPREGPSITAVPQSMETTPVPAVNTLSILNVPPAEAERRRDTAIRLLTERGIDPATLSADQFSIFANQAPQLQGSSLDMLAKYGAERLRIIHPEDKNPGASDVSSLQQPSTSLTPVSRDNSTPEVLDGPARQLRGSTPSTAVAPVAAADTAPVPPAEVQSDSIIPGLALPPALPPKIRKSRVLCSPCKQQKAKCTKELPICSICAAAGTECSYPAPKPRSIWKVPPTQTPQSNDVSHSQHEIASASHYTDLGQDAARITYQTTTIPTDSEPGPSNTYSSVPSANYSRGDDPNGPLRQPAHDPGPHGTRGADIMEWSSPQARITGPSTSAEAPEQKWYDGFPSGGNISGGYSPNSVGPVPAPPPSEQAQASSWGGYTGPGYNGNGWM